MNQSVSTDCQTAERKCKDSSYVSQTVMCQVNNKYRSRVINLSSSFECLKTKHVNKYVWVSKNVSTKLNHILIDIYCRFSLRKLPHPFHLLCPW